METITNELIVYAKAFTAAYNAKYWGTFEVLKAEGVEEGLAGRTAYRTAKQAGEEAGKKAAPSVGAPETAGTKTQTTNQGTCALIS